MKQDHDWSVSATSDHCQDPQPTRFQGMDLDAELPTADGANGSTPRRWPIRGPRAWPNTLFGTTIVGARDTCDSVAAQL